MSAERLRDLRAKYVEMRSMRTDHEAGTTGDPRARMRALAERFPGALREIDELPMHAIDARIAEIDDAIGGAKGEPQWARCASCYHGWMRVLLGVRRAAGRAHDRDSASRWLELYAPSGDEPSRGELEVLLDEVLKPPQGRLHLWLIRRIAAAERSTADEIEALIFPRHARAAK